MSERSLQSKIQPLDVTVFSSKSKYYTLLLFCVMRVGFELIPSWSESRQPLLLDFDCISPPSSKRLVILPAWIPCRAPVLTVSQSARIWSLHANDFPSASPYLTQSTRYPLASPLDTRLSLTRHMPFWRPRSRR